jgi:hypothetical protein
MYFWRSIPKGLGTRFNSRFGSTHANGKPEQFNEPGGNLFGRIVVLALAFNL